MVRVTTVPRQFEVFWTSLIKVCQPINGKYTANASAPNCPEQNPIEDIWLQAKTWVRRFCALIPSFSHLKWMFEWFIRHTTFDFDTLAMYGVFSKIK
jgi:putative transposase